MPRNASDDTRFALAAQFNLRKLGGVSVFKRAADADPIVLPSWGAGEGKYPDVLAFLHSFASDADLFDDIDAHGLTLSINANDKVVVTNAGLAVATLTASSDNLWWGLPAAGGAIAAEGGTLTGTSEWRRGLVSYGPDLVPPRLQFTIAGELGVRRLPNEPGICQDVRCSLRKRGVVADSDDTGATTLEGMDNGVNDPSDKSFRWFRTDDGHIGWCGTAVSGVIIWLSTIFRDLLGFDGTESLIRFAPAGGGGGIESGVCYGQIANRPCPFVFIPRRPLIRQRPGADAIGGELRMASGAWVGVHSGHYPRQTLTFWVEGPQDVGTDWHRHWLRFRGYTPRGFPITFYQDSGDSRLALGIESIDVSLLAYTLLHTTQANGHYGRIVGFVHPSTPDPDEDFEGSFRIRAIGELTIATGGRYGA